MGEVGNAYRILVEKPERKRDLSETGPHGRVILNWELHKVAVRMWAGFIWVKIRTRDW
jgi:hypothetical protein